MNNLTELSRLAEIFNRSTCGGILIPSSPSTDTVASATALYLALTKIGKNISLACSSKIEDIPIAAAEKFQQDIVFSGDNLVISFPYIDGAIDKVDYRINSDKFELIIAPRPGNPKIDSSQVKFTYSGGKADFFVIIDAVNLNALGELYENNKNQFYGIEIINIDRHLTNANFGTINLVNKTISSTSEIVFAIIQSLKIEIDKDIATNLYTGIVAATNNFTSYSVNADTLETAAKLLRLGALKKPIKKSFFPSSSLPSASLSSSNQTPIKKIYSEEIKTKPIDKVEKEDKEEQKLPPDWLKPKIFRGGLI